MVNNIIILFLTTTAVEAVAVASDINVLLVLLDDASMSDFNILGSEAYTPSIDAFINNSLYFPNAFSGGVVCSPSRATIQTGRSPMREGITQANVKNGQLKSYFAPYTLRRNAFTIADLLKSQSYETMYFGKWHLSNVNAGGINPVTLSEYGYDKAVVCSVSRKLFDANPNVYFDENGQKIPDDLRNKFSNRFTDDALIEIAIENLERVKANSSISKWFIMLGMHTTHTFNNEIHVDPKTFKKCKNGETCANIEQKTNDQLKYETTVNDFDASFGKLIQKLKTLNYYENTFVILTSDNGLEDRAFQSVTSDKKLRRPYRAAKLGTVSGLFKGSEKIYFDRKKNNYIGAKRSLYSGGNRIGMALQFPQMIDKPLSKPRVIFDNVYQGDILPTIAALLSLNLSHFTSDIIDGVDLMGHFKGTSVIRDKPIIIGALTSSIGIGTTCASDYLSVVLGNFSFLTQKYGNQLKLFNTYEDPGQRRNIVDENHILVSKFKKYISDFIKSLELSYLFESYLNDCSKSHDKTIQIRRPTFIPNGYRRIQNKQVLKKRNIIGVFNGVRNVYMCSKKCTSGCKGFSYKYYIKTTSRCITYSSWSSKTSRMVRKEVFYIKNENYKTI